MVLTGAGISAASGIPTYRDGDGRWTGRDPIKDQEFVADPARRQRYWARSMMGWPLVRDAGPSLGHHALARLQAAGRVGLIITQNVDRLHQSAGSEQVIDLHGRLDRVVCLQCGRYCSRESVQQRLLQLNAGVVPQASVPAPDGDADTPEAAADAITVPACIQCGGVLKPDVVFFGGSVPSARVTACMESVAGADALLAVGSSLQVYSGYRFCRHAAELGNPIALVNPGATRADSLASLKLAVDCGPLLWSLAGTLQTADAGGAAAGEGR